MKQVCGSRLENSSGSRLENSSGSRLENSRDLEFWSLLFEADLKNANQASGPRQEPNSGVLEYWSIGYEEKQLFFRSFPVLHHSIAPLPRAPFLPLLNVTAKPRMYF
jgi:hypothetical protein